MKASWLGPAQATRVRADLRFCRARVSSDPQNDCRGSRASDEQSVRIGLRRDLGAGAGELQVSTYYDYFEARFRRAVRARATVPSSVLGAQQRVECRMSRWCSRLRTLERR
eukprot:4679376-Prymnesium_polylepis.1